VLHIHPKLVSVSYIWNNTVQNLSVSCVAKKKNQNYIRDYCE